MRSIAERLRTHSEREKQLAGIVGRLRARSGRQPPASRLPTTPFDEVFAAVSTDANEPPAVLPPRSRFMVRVAKVGRPHRATRRNYDYFEDLNAALAAKQDERPSPEQD
jgi:hypothetical protein